MRCSGVVRVGRPWRSDGLAGRKWKRTSELHQVLQKALAVSQRAGPQKLHQSQKSASPKAPEFLFREPSGLTSTFWFVLLWWFVDSCQVQHSGKKKKNNNELFPQNFPMCLHPHPPYVVLSQRAISLRCHGEISTAVLIYSPISLSSEGNHLPVERDAIAPPTFPLQPPPYHLLFIFLHLFQQRTPYPWTSAFIIGKGNGCLSFKVGPLTSSFSLRARQHEGCGGFAALFAGAGAYSPVDWQDRTAVWSARRPVRPDSEPRRSAYPGWEHMWNFNLR